MRKFYLGAVALALLFVLAACSGDSDTFAPEAELEMLGQGCENRTNNTYRKLLECVTVDGVRQHQEAFQAIADANEGVYPGTRTAGTVGYQGSVDYVAGLLEEAGYEVTLDPFEFTFTFPAILNQITPVPANYATGAFTGSGSGEVTGPVFPIDLALEDPASSTSGCEPEDFAGFDFSGDNDIALVQRGACFFSIKAVNAEAAGAEAIVIFNQGTPGREGLIVANAANLPDGSPSNIGIPVVGASFADGVALSVDGSTAFVDVIPNETRTDYNVIAELPGKNNNNVVMAGAHLDSVRAGPGVQDNGSGSAAILEVALQIAKLKPENTLRFAWWGAEELGLIGSTAYVNELSQEALDRIALYLNFDMIGSPNYFLGVYDADQSSFTTTAPIPDGSIAIEDVFESFYTYAGVPYDDSAFSGRSDYQAFINNGIPSSGLFTGAEVIKTEEQEGIWGGTAGEQFDPCYHLACDTFDNISLEALDVNSDAVAFAVMTYAYSTESVNGVPGKRVPGKFDLPEPAGPKFTFIDSDGGGGLEPDHDHDHDGDPQ